MNQTSSSSSVFMTIFCRLYLENTEATKDGHEHREKSILIEIQRRRILTLTPLHLPFKNTNREPRWTQYSSRNSKIYQGNLNPKGDE